MHFIFVIFFANDLQVDLVLTRNIALLLKQQSGISRIQQVSFQKKLALELIGTILELQLQLNCACQIMILIGNKDFGHLTFTWLLGYLATPTLKSYRLFNVHNLVPDHVGLSHVLVICCPSVIFLSWMGKGLLTRTVKA